MAHKCLYGMCKRVYTEAILGPSADTDESNLSITFNFRYFSIEKYWLDLQPRENIFFSQKNILFIGRSFCRKFVIFFKTLMYNGKLPRNRIPLEFFRFGYFPARNKLVVSKSVRKNVIAYYVRRWASRSKNGVAAPAVSTIWDQTHVCPGVD